MGVVKTKIERLQVAITLRQQAIERLRLRIQQLRARCPHTFRERWTNNDGDGQFLVERCLECGAQADGGLGRD